MNSKYTANKEVRITQDTYFFGQRVGAGNIFRSMGEGFFAPRRSEKLFPSLNREIWKKGVR
jgi:hypothetical protein